MAAILHIGNVEFAKGADADSSVIKDEKSRFHLNMIAELLKYDLFIFFLNIFLISYLAYIVSLINISHKLYIYNRCDVKSLEDALIKRVMVTPEEIITRTLDPVAAVSSRDALAKTIYSRLFDW